MTLRKLIAENETCKYTQENLPNKDWYITYDYVLHWWVDNYGNPFYLTTNEMISDDWVIFEENPWKPISEFATEQEFILENGSTILTFYRWVQGQKQRTLWWREVNTIEWTKCILTEDMLERRGKLPK